MVMLKLKLTRPVSLLFQLTVLLEVTNTSCLNSQCVLMLINLVLQIECFQLEIVFQPE